MLNKEVMRCLSRAITVEQKLVIFARHRLRRALSNDNAAIQHHSARAELDYGPGIVRHEQYGRSLQTQLLETSKAFFLEASVAYR